MKKLIVIAVVISIISILVIATAYANELTTSEAYIPSETLIKGQVTLSSYECVNLEDKEQIKNYIKLYEEKMNMAKKIEESSYTLGYNEEHILIKVAKKEWSNAKEAYDFYTKNYSEILWQEKASKYPAAAEVWQFLKNKGYNDYVCAGIIGNLMAEVGGQTLDIKYWTQGKGYYGMCQWNIHYFPGVVGKDLQGQCKFLAKNIERAFNTWGFLYKKDFNYDKFCKMTDEKEVALAFAECYERCGSASYSQRQKNATKAYEYFTE